MIRLYEFFCWVNGNFDTGRKYFDLWVLFFVYLLGECKSLHSVEKCYLRVVTMSRVNNMLILDKCFVQL